MRRALLLVLLAACGGSDDGGAWMASSPDATSLAALSIPGTHDSGARFEPLAGTAATQELTIAEQLDAGIRFFDIRCRHVDDAFLIYHGSYDQNQTFDELVATMYAYLSAHPSEAILASIQQEATPNGNTRAFDETLAAYIAQQPDRWELGAGVPALGDVRGKLVLFRRFATTMAPLGIDATSWPDNSSFAIENAASLRIEDEYMVSSNDAKWSAITANLAAADIGAPTTLYLTFTSGYQTMAGLPNIRIVSDDINARLDDYVAHGNARLGVLVMDHVTPERVRTIAERNQ